MTRVVYEPPQNLFEAKVQRARLVEEISDISTQLSNKNKQDRCSACNGDGCQSCHQGYVRWSNERYHTWRQGAITALRARESALRQTNAWIEARTDTLKPLTAGEQQEKGEADRLLEKAYGLLQRLREDLDGDLDPDEVEVVESVGEYLRGVG